MPGQESLAHNLVLLSGWVVAAASESDSGMVFSPLYRANLPLAEEKFCTTSCYSAEYKIFSVLGQPPLPSRACGGHDRGPGDKPETGAANSRVIVPGLSPVARHKRAKADPLGAERAQSANGTAPPGGALEELPPAPTRDGWPPKTHTAKQLPPQQRHQHKPTVTSKN